VNSCARSVPAARVTGRSSRPLPVSHVRRRLNDRSVERTRLRGLTTLGVVVGVLLVVSTPGCGCTAEANAGLILEIRDESGSPAAKGASVEARDGAYVERLRVSDSLTSSGAVERPGSYEVTVTKPGFDKWSERIDVGRSGLCKHIRTRRVSVTLEPLP
jgi:hypothetical protein